MSDKKIRSWLQSYHESTLNDPSHKCKTIAIASGKGGVGKTSTALKFSQILSSRNQKVLLIDCDFNLSNTAVKLGLQLTNNFLKFLNNQATIDDCIQKVNGFDLISACSGETDLITKSENLTNEIVQIINTKESGYDYIILDCPAGVSKNTLDLFAYCDEHIVVMTPERSSITDSYSLIKLISKTFNIKNISLIVNKVSTKKQFIKLSNVFLNTVDQFLDCSVKILGSVEYINIALDRFDQVLIKNAGSSLHKEFSKIIDTYTEKKWTDTESVTSFLPINRKNLSGLEDNRSLR